MKVMVPHPADLQPVINSILHIEPVPDGSIIYFFLDNVIRAVVRFPGGKLSRPHEKPHVIAEIVREIPPVPCYRINTAVINVHPASDNQGHQPSVKLDCKIDDRPVRAIMDDLAVLVVASFLLSMESR